MRRSCFTPRPGVICQAFHSLNGTVSADGIEDKSPLHHSAGGLEGCFISRPDLITGGSLSHISCGVAVGNKDHIGVVTIVEINIVDCPQSGIPVGSVEVLVFAIDLRARYKSIIACSGGDIGGSIVSENNERQFHSVGRIVAYAIVGQEGLCQRFNCFQSGCHTILVTGLTGIALAGILGAGGNSAVPGIVVPAIAGSYYSIQRKILVGLVIMTVQSIPVGVGGGISFNRVSGVVDIHTVGCIQHNNDVCFLNFLFRVTGYVQCNGIGTVCILRNLFGVCRFLPHCRRGYAGQHSKAHGEKQENAEHFFESSPFHFSSSYLA